ncbi:bifunctional phosphoribosylaminoimidazolecarboxamide formyltransferase/inosine monophosphate cyclohydrolase [Pseudoclavibacter sp. RFBG4]|uniref:bifunctional phosphoribosylaminoimidazolecarboxamide formyltransferase/IMP cyclohydrolase n=1 Tax=Pseudoclavibacter sp. RFBG4 TaxID=2080575 RepID=UPI000CE765B4|nr:bifunctional phosphoribosylaminoimidazolecarboxamide formyltransferase/IMP cyclohydrolase [Pseudoclavibacter sp. RFBG4]PPG30810.1 bifunctional phosphoribosylaminoimidazolecarboxamide formyltransferase/inosine monophosphate cyclohydrolase [Pseudoclavibacter sp. RFBG4]
MSTPASHESLTTLERIEPKRALVSVSDKSGLLELAAGLKAAGVEIVSTGSTAKTIREAGFDVTDVQQVTGFPESLDGRVKTLHPGVHAGILADRRIADHLRQLEELGIEPFELIVVNLYPFVETVASGADAPAIIEQIDIGGPALVRASAKNFANATIVTSPSDYTRVLDEISGGGVTLSTRRALAAAAFQHTSSYDQAVGAWFASHILEVESAGTAEPAAGSASDALPGSFTIKGSQLAVLRYGENSHQVAAVYGRADGRGIAQAEQLHGKEMSYNNYVDADAALRAAFDHTSPAVAIIKHANPCGIAIAPEGLAPAEAIAEAHRRAHACDPVSAYGGVVAANREVSLEMAQTLAKIFTEVVIAPSFAPEALEVLRAKKNVRLLQLPANPTQEEREVRQISGGFLVQSADRFEPNVSLIESWTLVSGAPATGQTVEDLEFAWRACRAVKSNAILLAADGASVGVGMGQVNRVDSCHLAVSRAGERAAGSVAASDAFFPFADGLEVLLEAGVSAVVQPGGSIRDEEVIAAAEKAGVTMYFTGERHFFH